MIKNSGFGPVLLKVQGTRLAIGRGEAKAIYVFKQN
ncbi:MAG: ferrous iron transport protein A [Candidatus Omnitrophica bacterium]|nr:ferrous iron transport protein A [Candidatus Omnitrophota bacterium]